eukprot:11844283-Alexandrium_andersonii.AAC.1
MQRRCKLGTSHNDFAQGWFPNCARGLLRCTTCSFGRPVPVGRKSIACSRLGSRHGHVHLVLASLAP